MPAQRLPHQQCLQSGIMLQKSPCLLLQAWARLKVSQPHYPSDAGQLHSAQLWFQPPGLHIAGRLPWPLSELRVQSKAATADHTSFILLPTGARRGRGHCSFSVPAAGQLHSAELQSSHLARKSQADCPGQFCSCRLSMRQPHQDTTTSTLPTGTRRGRGHCGLSVADAGQRTALLWAGAPHPQPEAALPPGDE